MRIEIEIPDEYLEEYLNLRILGGLTLARTVENEEIREVPITDIKQVSGVFTPNCSIHNMGDCPHHWDL